MNTTTNTAASETTTETTITATETATESTAAAARFDLRAACEDVTFGVEIETSGVSKETVALRLAAKFGWAASVFDHQARGYRITMADGRSWLAVHDGSIRGYENAEVVTPILKGDADLQLLQEVVRELRAIGCKSSAELGCGIHVHVGVAGLGIPAIGRLAKVVAKADAYIRRAVGVSETRARWCAPLGAGESGEISPDLLGRARSASELAAAWYGAGTNVDHASTWHYHPSRYRGLNLHSFFYRPNGGAARGTAEFRYFDGTLHAGEVKSYVQLCLGLVCYAARAKTASSKPMAMTHGRGQLATWRQFMLTLGLVGDHYKTARTLLSARFPQEVRRAVVAPVASSTASAE